MIQRRSFISSLVAMLGALSPLFCGLLRGIGFSGVSRDKRPPLELWEMESSWDGTLSPYFRMRHRVGEWAPMSPLPTAPPAPPVDEILDEEHRRACDEAWDRREAEWKENAAFREKYEAEFPFTYKQSPETGSFADIVSPKC